jgi:aldose sugar dehydrogenase
MATDGERDDQPTPRERGKKLPLTQWALVALSVGLLSCTTRALVQNGGASSEVIQTISGPVYIERLATLEQPWGMTYLPDKRLLITEKPGRLRVYADGKLSAPIGGVPKVAYGGQGGLLDVEIDPDFARNGFVYLAYAEAGDGSEGKGTRGGAVARGRLEGNELRDVKVIWRQVPKMTGSGHYGGRLIFAPDGKLFITSGERQHFDPAQDLATNLGKIVRINSDGSIPEDNPFVGKSGVRPDVWSSGHRNPLGAAIHPQSGRLWIHEMGPRHGDEVNIPEPGKNYGWPIVSNGDHYDGRTIPDHPTRPEFAAPAYFWKPAVSPSGLIFYTGDRFAGWRNSMLLGGLSSQALVRLTLDGTRVVEAERLALGRRIRDVIQSPDGSVLLLTDDDNGELLRLTPASR